MAAAFEARDALKIEAELKALVGGNRHFDRAFLADAAGVEWFGWPEDLGVIGKSFAHRDWYKGAKSSGKTYLSELYLRASLDQSQAVAVATPIDSASGERLGYLVAHHPIALLTRRLQAIEGDDSTRLTLVDHHRQLVVVGADPHVEPSKLGDHPLAKPAVAEVEGSLTERDPGTGEACMFSFARVWARSPSQNRSGASVRTLRTWRAIAVSGNRSCTQLIVVADLSVARASPTTESIGGSVIRITVSVALRCRKSHQAAESMNVQ